MQVQTIQNENKGTGILNWYMCRVDYTCNTPYSYEVTHANSALPWGYKSHVNTVVRH